MCICRINGDTLSISNAQKLILYIVYKIIKDMFSCSTYGLDFHSTGERNLFVYYNTAHDKWGHILYLNTLAVTIFRYGPYLDMEFVATVDLYVGVCCIKCTGRI